MRITKPKTEGYENNLSVYLKKKERGLDQSPYDVESADCMTAPKLVFSNSMIDLKNDYEAQLRGLAEPISHTSEESESLMMKFPNDIESARRFPPSPIAKPLKEIDSFENSADVYTDKTVTECEPEQVVCYKESNYNVVKDICVDEGVLTKDKVMFENSLVGKAYNFFPSESYENKEKKEDSGVDVVNLPATEESDPDPAHHDQPKDLMHKDEDVTKQLFGNVNKEMVLREDKVLFQELGTQESVPSDDMREQVSGEPELHSQSEEPKNMLEEAVLASPSALAIDESNGGSMLLENGSYTYQFDPSSATGCGRKECLQVGGCKCDETQNTSTAADGKSGDEAVTSQVRHSLGESSFSAVGTVSSRISYSGPVPYSGSISIRSDSSTTSTRSFAFPVLQSEWNSSPVRMAKADRSHYRKHRGWRQGLLCCRF